MISGVIIKVLKQIEDDRGKVMHMVKNEIKNPIKFGEIYFSTVNQGKIKGWNYHKKMTLNYAVISGKIKLVLYDGRSKSKTSGSIQEIILSNENYSLVTIPPQIWISFKCIGEKSAVIANFTDLPHDDNEIERKSFTDKTIPYDWN
tara:strand:+ start:5813 stop:6250 length:438 start_codon:yes stop_codon:yes gene_type:complete